MVEIMSYNITLFWRLYNLNVDKFLRKQVFISLSYASRAASLRPELVQPEKQPALALGIGISTLRSVGQDKWGLTRYPGAIYIGLDMSIMFNPCSLSQWQFVNSLFTFLLLEQKPPLLPKCGLHLDRKYSKDTLHSRI